ncbi:uncharacterized protein LOC101846450 [Aplysia californica]|uniref:Uncharacterized protein LOC101846450 n=1 Tax=Aplysia californica TaxID=6500 RepID=A0ABM0K0I4_APLCA|nr:uncharacterized protein LOC101846450 [Aplysia californica]
MSPEILGTTAPGTEKLSNFPIDNISDQDIEKDFLDLNKSYDDKGDDDKIVGDTPDDNAGKTASSRTFDNVYGVNGLASKNQRNSLSRTEKGDMTSKTEGRSSKTWNYLNFAEAEKGIEKDKLKLSRESNYHGNTMRTGHAFQRDQIDSDYSEQMPYFAKDNWLGNISTHNSTPVDDRIASPRDFDLKKLLHSHDINDVTSNMLLETPELQHPHQTSSNIGDPHYKMEHSKGLSLEDFMNSLKHEVNSSELVASFPSSRTPHQGPLFSPTEGSDTPTFQSKTSSPSYYIRGLPGEKSSRGPSKAKIVRDGGQNDAQLRGENSRRKQRIGDKTVVKKPRPGPLRRHHRILAHWNPRHVDRSPLNTDNSTSELDESIVSAMMTAADRRHGNHSVFHVADRGRDIVTLNVTHSSWLTPIHGHRGIITAGCVVAGVGLLLILFAIINIIINRRQQRAGPNKNNNKRYRKLGNAKERQVLHRKEYSLFPLSSSDDDEDDLDEDEHFGRHRMMVQ